MKLITKGIITFIAINFILGSLRQEGIITGSISINYAKLFNKIGNNFCIEFTGSDNRIQQRDRVERLDFNFENRRDNDFRNHNGLLDEEADFFNESESKQKCNYHILRRGETLITLSSKYGVPWREIQLVNQIRNARRIRPGQRIAIPAHFGDNRNT